jgi:DNA-binding MarR family transcriptional regulator/GNAT superfamily N-acetyltransferase
MADVALLRRFNRSHTQRIGALDESFLDTGRPLGPSRLLFEIGPGPVRLLDLRRRLGLDSGYLSRMLRGLEQEGLVAIDPDPADGRQRVVRLTAAGRREWRRLDRRSEDLAQRLVAPLSDRQRAELDAALATADRLLRAATISFDTVDPRAADARQAMTDYFTELAARFPGGFDPGDALDTDAPAFSAPDGAFVVAHDGTEAVGCGGLQRLGPATAEIKRMWVHSEWRALGLGRRLLAHLESLARSQGRTTMVLDTNSTLREAITMYERAGYHAIERYNDNPYAQRWFAKDL